MNERKAIAELVKLYGKHNAAWRINKGAPTPEERAAADAAIPALQVARDKAKEAMERKRAELLRDPDYQRLVAEYKAASAATDSACSTARIKRITVGKLTSMFFHVTGEGDTWAEALAAARKHGS